MHDAPEVSQPRGDGVPSTEIQTTCACSPQETQTLSSADSWTEARAGVDLKPTLRSLLTLAAALTSLNTSTLSSPLGSSTASRTASWTVAATGDANASEPAQKQNQEGLSNGATAAIVVGVLLVLAAYAYAMWIVMQSRRRKRSSATSAWRWSDDVAMNNLSPNRRHVPMGHLDAWYSLHGGGDARGPPGPLCSRGLRRRDEQQSGRSDREAAGASSLRRGIKGWAATGGCKTRRGRGTRRLATGAVLAFDTARHVQYQGVTT